MALKIQRQPRENSQRLVYRFAKRIRKSGILLEARKKQFRRHPQNDQSQKKSALRRIKLKEEYEKLKKMGKI